MHRSEVLLHLLAHVVAFGRRFAGRVVARHVQVGEGGGIARLDVVLEWCVTSGELANKGENERKNNGEIEGKMDKKKEGNREREREEEP